MVLVNGFDALVETSSGLYDISSQHYTPNVISPDGSRRLESFDEQPWPRWIWRLGDGAYIEQELFVVHGHCIVALRWRLLQPQGDVTLEVRPFLSGRDYHALHRENPDFRFEAEVAGEEVVWRPYDGVPATVVLSNGRYVQHPDWYRNFLYEEERARGLDHIEDLASPGLFRWDLSQAEAVWILAAEGHVAALQSAGGSAMEMLQRLRTDELARRQQFACPLHRAADAYIVERGTGKTIVAGYPWFTDWGRDTFIALRGLCLATGNLDAARDILVPWAGVVSEGMVPNRFPDHGEVQEYNSVDASLWFVIAAYDFLNAMQAACRDIQAADRESLQQAIETILSAYRRGTRHRIRMDDDGLLAAGDLGLQLTWMDAKVDDWVMTPRTGKPVEVQALWLNALWIGARFSAEWQPLFDLGRQSFQDRFWNEHGGYLYDVVDLNHQPGIADDSFRPNQILAIGGLPLALVEGERARQVVDAVEDRLWTPMGLRSLEPASPQYVPHYAGGVRQRDGSYHQGTVWPWLTGPFVEAWLRVRNHTPAAREEARQRLLAPLVEHLHDAGLGHISEIADGDPPHTPRGCPFQAWSLGELLRLKYVVLVDEPSS
jgi:predicted glycogen debranching enzyme